MVKYKNALRKHYIAPYDTENPSVEPTDDQWMWLAKGIKESAPENDEETDDAAYFDGDGTVNEVVTSKSIGRSFEGHREYGDPAQDYIADKEDEIGDDLLVWYKEVRPSQNVMRVGPARLSEIEIGDGEATEFESFKANIIWTNKPKRTELGASSQPASKASTSDSTSSAAAKSESTTSK